MFRFPLPLLLLGGLLLAAPGRAAVVSGSFAGILNGGIRDSYGLFGAAAADLSGQGIAASYRYDTGVAFAYVAQPGSDAYLGTDNLTLSVTVGGVTVSNAGVTDSEVMDAKDRSLTQVTLAVFAPTPLIDFVLRATAPWIPGFTIAAPFGLDPSDDGQTIYVSADGSHYDSLSFMAVPAAEPGSLALLGSGFVALGWLRRRHRAAHIRAGNEATAPFHSDVC